MIEASIIISHKNRLNLLRKCIESVKNYTKDVMYELYIIDAGSTDGSCDLLLDTKLNFGVEAKVIFETQPSTYAESNNRVMRKCNTPYIYLINNDCEALPGWLYNAIEFAKQDNSIGHVASQVLWGKNSLIQSAGANIETNGNSESHLFNYNVNVKEANKICNTAYAGLGLYRKDLLEKLDYMPEYPSKIYWSDTGWGMKVWEAGYDVRYCPSSKVIHLLHSSEREGHIKDVNQGRIAFMQDWGKFLTENNGFKPDYPFTGKRPYRNINLV